MDTAAVQDFAASHEARLLRYAFLLSGSRSDAEDLVQTAFLRLLQGRGRDIRQLPAYAKRMIYHDFCDRRRRKPVEVVSEVADVPAFEQDVVDRRWMWAELSALSPRQRAVLVLRYYEGLPDEEIAAVLGCRRTTVRSLVARALQQLRERYDAAAPDASPATGQERTQP